ncbi:DUF2156 domain-containing protein [Rhizobium sp. NZLR8]|uniref:phosphatidylglycerol lysyltransferase domain-containing protein n=1 Tax=Rhizobium sp. NZLR8 TaxID=2731104 RepID=UPI001C82A578|nr:phosphatidylglycerol lysyltransferase domain-containing protein [Rhizobium sp. NZLR8]MBX5159067.1 DUF2156 domain-containing protein [Rhizobium sp. NZLR8]
MPNIRRLFDEIMDRRLTAIPNTSVSADKRLELCRKHGDFAVAYSTAVQRDLKHFGDEQGYLAYATKMGHTFVLGDPVACKQDRERYIRDFVSAAANPCFVQIGRETATVLAELGYRVNHMGVDTHLSFDTHSFAGKKNETVRYSERWLIKQGYAIIERDGTRTQADQIKAVSDNWRAGRIVSRREMRFLNRPFFPELSPHMRRFVILDPKGAPIALLDFDPIFEGGVVEGYTAAFKRKLAGTTPHAEVGLTKFAADRFREEGHARVTLGLSPLAAIAESGFSESRFWRALFERAFRSDRVNTHIFNLRGQAAFKRRFHGEEVPTYIAFKRRTPMEMVALLRLLKTL